MAYAKMCVPHTFVCQRDRVVRSRVLAHFTGHVALAMLPNAIVICYRTNWSGYVKSVHTKRAEAGRAAPSRNHLKPRVTLQRICLNTSIASHL